ncbi:ACT domain-containing protein [Propionibacterium sp.]|uniref:ACT domain-containing protein n=1 Tax=Propionibacterium sp. TaxID=1977903 RepID=UPI0039EC8FA5
MTTSWEATDGEETDPPRRYVAYVLAVDRPGVLTSVTEVVSSRGVSIQSFETGDARSGFAILTLVFTTSGRRRKMIERILARLATVAEVLLLPADDPRVLAAGVVHPSKGRTFRPPPDAVVTWSGDTASGQPLLVEGQYLHVAALLEKAIEAGASRVSFTLLPPSRMAWPTTRNEHR